MLSVTSGLKVEAQGTFGSLLGEGAGLTAPEWDALLARSACDVPFMTWQWQASWWQHFCQENCTLHLLAIREENGELIGIAPIFIALEPMPPLKEYVRGELRPDGEGEARRIVRIVGGKDVADYLDLLAPPERLSAVWSSVLGYLQERTGEWDIIDVHSLPDFSPSRDLLQGLCKEQGLNVRLFAEDVSPVLPLPGDWEAYLGSLRKKDRHELRRKVRKLEGRDDVRWRLVPATDAAALQRGMQDFIDLHRQSGADKALFMTDYMASYFLDMASDLASTGWIDLAILDINGEPASAYLSFAYKGRIYLYNSGYDPHFASYSAGVALLAYRINKAIKQGYSAFDFLRGDEPYKYGFGAKDTFVYRAVIEKRK
ncbi:MAG: GNAT family N-acetyltransferase [Chloroflexota bacterium]|nr:GNAT family N-acetyltransferase [Chloroflexota bacterium]